MTMKQKGKGSKRGGITSEHTTPDRLVLDLLTRRDGRRSWPRWPVTYREVLPARRRSSIQVQTRQSTARNRSHVRRPNHYTAKPPNTVSNGCIVQRFCLSL